MTRRFSSFIIFPKAFETFFPNISPSRLKYTDSFLPNFTQNAGIYSANEPQAAFSERNENNWNNYVKKLELIIHFFSFLE